MNTAKAGTKWLLDIVPTLRWQTWNYWVTRVFLVAQISPIKLCEGIRINDDNDMPLNTNLTKSTAHLSSLEPELRSGSGPQAGTEKDRLTRVNVTVPALKGSSAQVGRKA